MPDLDMNVKYEGGTLYVPIFGYKVRAQVKGMHEYHKVQMLRGIVKPGMTCLDIGASVGYYTFLFAKWMNDEGKVIAFEPDPKSMQYLNTGQIANKYKSVVIYDIALADRRGVAVFYLGKELGWGSLFNTPVAKGNVVTVEARTLDEMMAMEEIEKVDIMKVDAEDADYIVLKGAKKTIENSPDIVIAMDMHLTLKWTKVLDLVHQYDLKAYWLSQPKMVDLTIERRFEAVVCRKDNDVWKKYCKTEITADHIDRMGTDLYPWDV